MRGNISPLLLGKRKTFFNFDQTLDEWEEVELRKRFIILPDSDV